MHWWHCQFQFRSIFDERHEIGQGICMNARNTTGLCGQILSCCFDLIVSITKISKDWEFAHIAWLCPWRSYIYFVWVLGVCWKRNKIEIVEAKYAILSQKARGLQKASNKFQNRQDFRIILWFGDIEKDIKKWLAIDISR